MSSFVWYLPLAQIVAPYERSGILSMLIWIVIVGAGLAVVYVALQKFGIKIPEWFIHIVWIVIVALVAIFAIRLIASI